MFHFVDLALGGQKNNIGHRHWHNLVSTFFYPIRHKITPLSICPLSLSLLNYMTMSVYLCASCLPLRNNSLVQWPCQCQSLHTLHGPSGDSALQPYGQIWCRHCHKSHCSGLKLFQLYTSNSQTMRDTLRLLWRYLACPPWKKKNTVYFFLLWLHKYKQPITAKVRRN